MSTLLPFLALNQPCEQVQAWISQQLTSAGLRVAQTFDLQVARLAHSDCPCPHHGTDRCNCQMIVLLVYRKKQENPATLVMHGQDDKTWLSLTNPMGQRANQPLEATVRRVLLPLRTDTPSPVEAAYEVRSTS